jgi:histidinol-phosphate aminotransferase
VATADELVRLARSIPEVAVILDHAYVEYAEQDLTVVATELANVIVVRTFSKAWGLAGLRVGYAIADPEVTAVLRNAGNPYPVPGPSLVMAQARLLTDQAAMAAHVSAVAAHRGSLLAGLAAAGVPTPASQGNFVCPDFGGKADRVYEAFRRRGIVTRRYPHRRGLETSIRITVPEDKADFDRLEEAMQSILEQERT